MKVNLAGVERDLRTPEQLEAEFETKSSERDADTRKINLLNEEKEKQAESIRNKYRRQISVISNEMHLLESQLQQYPTKMKNLKAELVSWQRKEDEWKKKTVGRNRNKHRR